MHHLAAQHSDCPWLGWRWLHVASAMLVPAPPMCVVELHVAPGWSGTTAVLQLKDVVGWRNAVQDMHECLGSLWWLLPAAPGRHCIVTMPAVVSVYCHYARRGVSVLSLCSPWCQCIVIMLAVVSVYCHNARRGVSVLSQCPPWCALWSPACASA